MRQLALHHPEAALSNTYPFPQTINRVVLVATLTGLVYFSEILYRSVGKISFTQGRLKNLKFAAN